MVCNLGEIAPDFKANTSTGPIQWHEYIDKSWAILFSHPGDYTPVCTTELGQVAKLKNEFDKRGVKVAALSCNSVDDHKGWVKDINAYCNTDVWYPIIEDLSRDLAVLYGMIDPEEKDAKGLPMTCRAVFFIGPDKKVKAKILYPPSTGRAFGEILRVIDSLQLAVNHSVATPVDWQPGDSCMILPTVSAEDAVTKFPKGFTVAALPSGKPYIRRTPQPNVDAKKGLARFPKETPWVIGVAAAVGVFAAALFRKQ